VRASLLEPYVFAEGESHRLVELRDVLYELSANPARNQGAPFEIVPIGLG
jgi:hypothetical protein